MKWIESGPRVPAKGSLEECVENGECRPRHRGHKSTRHWCKGRVGMAHEWHWQADHEWNSRWLSGWRPCGSAVSARPDVAALERLVCRECGKHEGSWRYRCPECLTFLPHTRRMNYLVHGQNCSRKDRVFGFYNRMQTWDELLEQHRRWPSQSGAELIVRAKGLLERHG